MEERGVQDPFDFEDRMAHSAGPAAEDAAQRQDDSTNTHDGAVNIHDEAVNTHDEVFHTHDGTRAIHDEAVTSHDEAGANSEALWDDDEEIDEELQAMIDHDLAILDREWAEGRAFLDIDGHSGGYCPFCDMMGKKSETSGFIGGIFDDEGNSIDPATIPIPGICIMCKTYDTDSWGEEILCMLTRYDAMLEDEEFRCHDFKPKFGVGLP